MAHCNDFSYIWKKQPLEAELRVNQAGEYGAKRIYQGQIAVLGNSAEGPLLKEMLHQELEHLDYFNHYLKTHLIRPTILSPLWHYLGYLLGYGTAQLGKEAAMVCTEAVEEVIDCHYQEQLNILKHHYPQETQLQEDIERIRQEEIHHRDTARAEGAHLALGYPVLKMAIRGFTKLAVTLSKKY